MSKKTAKRRRDVECKEDEDALSASHYNKKQMHSAIKKEPGVDDVEVKKEPGMNIKKEPGVAGTSKAIMKIKREVDDDDDTERKFVALKGPIVIKKETSADPSPGTVQKEPESQLYTKGLTKKSNRSPNDNQAKNNKNKKTKKGPHAKRSRSVSFATNSKSVETASRVVKTEDENGNRKFVYTSDLWFSAFKPSAKLEKDVNDFDVTADIRVATCDDYFFDVHSLVLCKASPVLKRVIEQAKSESDAKVAIVRLEETSKSDFELLLNLVYDGTVVCDQEQLQKIFSKLGITDYIDASGIAQGPRSDVSDHVMEALQRGGVIKTENGGGKCLTCGKAFSHYGNAKSHFDRMHTVTQDSNKFDCPICKKQNNNRTRLMDHLRKAHNINSRDLEGMSGNCT